MSEYEGHPPTYPPTLPTFAGRHRVWMEELREYIHTSLL